MTAAPARSIWGWGYQAEGPSEASLNRVLAALFPAFPEHASLPLFDLQLAIKRLREPRFKLPSEIKGICSQDPQERLRHTYGKSFKDVARAFSGSFDNAPDYVGFPSNEHDVQVLLKCSQDHNIAIVPFGGGTSVVGGVEGIVETPKYIGVISVDMKHFNKLVEVDKKSLSARVEAGVFGPALLDLLAPHGLTLRHFPQSFEFSTVGGWVATRAGGHYATGRTHIDDFVSSVRMITPAGIVETRRLPASGAGPAPDRLFIGSEGSLGIITSVWLRVQEIVRYKFAATVFFESFEDGVAATQEIAQSNINPSNCRLIDPLESFGNGLAKGMLATLILGFESAHDFDYGPIMKLALVICERHHGKCPKGVSRAAPAASNRDDSADTWKDSFIKAPYLRDALLQRGYISETFETCITWDKFWKLHSSIISAVTKSAPDSSRAIITCRFTHVYPDGPAPYFTVVVASKGKPVQEWERIKEAASKVILTHGATITHHHAVGRDHMPFYVQESDKLFLRSLTAVKRELDPHSIMNPGVLIPSKL